MLNKSEDNTTGVDDLKNNKLKFFILFLLVFYKNIKNGIYCQDNNRFFRNVLL